MADRPRWRFLAAALLAAGVALPLAVRAQGDEPGAFDGGRAYKHLQAIVAMGPRPAGSAALTRTRRYLTDTLNGLGLVAEERAFEAQTPLGAVPMVNVSATIPGDRPERVLIAGHYDTKRFDRFRFVGANDGGSSAGFLLELARVLVQQPRRLTIEIVFFDGEEALVSWDGTDHTYGSRHYVEEARRSGTVSSIGALVLVDMIGDRQLQIRREEASTSWLTETIWSAAAALGHTSTFLADTLLVEDDHLPFLRAGIPAVDIIDLQYPAWHTEHDTMDQVGARSLQTVGDVLLHALPRIEDRIIRDRP